MELIQREFETSTDQVRNTVSNLLESVDAKDREILRLNDENKRLRGILGVVEEESEGATPLAQGHESYDVSQTGEEEDSEDENQEGNLQ